MTDSQEIAGLIAKQLDERKGVDIQVIDLRQRAAFADFFVIASGTSSRHVQGLADEVDRVLHQHKVPLLGSEGVSQGEWILLDAGDVVVHLFQQEMREFYNLEKLWSATQDLVKEGRG